MEQTKQSSSPDPYQVNIYHPDTTKRTMQISILPGYSLPDSSELDPVSKRRLEALHSTRQFVRPLRRRR